MPHTKLGTLTPCISITSVRGAGFARPLIAWMLNTIPEDQHYWNNAYGQEEWYVT